MDKFICIKEAADIIGVTTTTLRRWEDGGRWWKNFTTP